MERTLDCVPATADNKRITLQQDWALQELGKSPTYIGLAQVFLLVFLQNRRLPQGFGGQR